MNVSHAVNDLKSTGNARHHSGNFRRRHGRVTDTGGLSTQRSRLTGKVLGFCSESGRLSEIATRCGCLGCRLGGRCVGSQGHGVFGQSQSFCSPDESDSGLNGSSACGDRFADIQKSVVSGFVFSNQSRVSGGVLQQPHDQGMAFCVARFGFFNQANQFRVVDLLLLHEVRRVNPETGVAEGSFHSEAVVAVANDGVVVEYPRGFHRGDRTFGTGAVHADIGAAASHLDLSG